MPEDISRDEAMIGQRQLLDSMVGRVHFTATGKDRMNDSLTRWVYDLLSDEENLKTGSVITALLRLPGPYWTQVSHVL